MVFESAVSGSMDLMAAMSKVTGNQVNNGLLILPSAFGKGYIKSVDLGSFRMMVHQCSLNEDLTLKRKGVETGKDMITFSFRNVIQEENRLFPSVLLSTGDLDLDIFIPAGTKMNTILIIMHVNLLKGLLNKKEGNTLLQHITSAHQPYLYEEIVSPEIQNIAIKIFEANVPEQLGDFYFKLKAEELIYLFFVELLKRQQTPAYPLNAADVKMIYQIRDKLMSDLSVPPDLTELTLFSNMSESKMNRLFKQIFGNSIYNYYQVLRMNEAAYLIREERLSISEVGYRLGFTNLSHFTRIFEKHIGLKPKKYSINNTSI